LYFLQLITRKRITNMNSLILYSCFIT